MKIRNIVLVTLLGLIAIDGFAEEYPFACESKEISIFKHNRYLSIDDSNNLYPLYVLDKKTIKIDRKNKIMKVWSTLVGSPKSRDDMIKRFKNNDYRNFGYMTDYMIIDFKNMKYKTA